MLFLLSPTSPRRRHRLLSPTPKLIYSSSDSIHWLFLLASKRIDENSGNLRLGHRQLYPPPPPLQYRSVPPATDALSRHAQCGTPTRGVPLRTWSADKPMQAPLATVYRLGFLTDSYCLRPLRTKRSISTQYRCRRNITTGEGAIPLVHRPERRSRERWIDPEASHLRPRREGPTHLYVPLL